MSTISPWQGRVGAVSACGRPEGADVTKRTWCGAVTAHQSVSGTAPTMHGMIATLFRGPVIHGLDLEATPSAHLGGRS